MKLNTYIITSILFNIMLTNKADEFECEIISTYNVLLETQTENPDPFTAVVRYTTKNTDFGTR